MTETKPTRARDDTRTVRSTALRRRSGGLLPLKGRFPTGRDPRSLCTADLRVCYSPQAVNPLAPHPPLCPPGGPKPNGGILCAGLFVFRRARARNVSTGSSRDSVRRLHGPLNLLEEGRGRIDSIGVGNLPDVPVHRLFGNALMPAYTAFLPSNCSMRRSWLYFAVRSVRLREPVLI